MNAMTATMAGLTVVLLVVTVARIWGDWNRFRTLCKEGCGEELEMLFSLEKAWVERHFLCGIVGVALIAIIKNDSGLTGFDDVAAAVGAYVVTSCIFVVVESIFAQKIERILHVARAAKNSAQRT